MQILDIVWTGCSIVLILLIFLKVPEKDGVMQNIEFSENLLGSPKLKNQILENSLWVLLVSFIFLSGLKNYLNT